jgi:hypothetical protein
MLLFYYYDRCSDHDDHSSSSSSSSSSGKCRGSDLVTHALRPPQASWLVHRASCIVAPITPHRRWDARMQKEVQSVALEGAVTNMSLSPDRSVLAATHGRAITFLDFTTYAMRCDV